MPIKSLWNIRKVYIAHPLDPEYGLFYGQDRIALFDDEAVARRVLVLLITAGDRMQFTALGGLELKPYEVKP